MFKCSVQEGWQNRNRLALGICFGQPRRAHQILFDVCGEVHPSHRWSRPTPGQDRFEVRFWKPDSLFLRCWLIFLIDIIGPSFLPIGPTLLAVAFAWIGG